MITMIAVTTDYDLHHGYTVALTAILQVRDYN